MFAEEDRAFDASELFILSNVMCSPIFDDRKPIRLRLGPCSTNMFMNEN